MSFGGFFGGSPSSSSSSSNTSQPARLASPSAFNSSESSNLRGRLQTAITQQSNILNAKILIQKVNETCFSHCVPNPSSSLSSKEQSCLSSCMEKYIDAWNVTSRTYIQRLQKEGAQLDLGSTGQGRAGPVEGKELF